MKTLSCWDGGMGRREGLKIPYLLQVCEFESHSQYKPTKLIQYEK